MPVPRYSLDALTEFTVRVFRHHGVPEADAQQAADVLRAGDRRGIDSHGVARLLAYHRKLDAGVTNPAPQIRVVRELPGTATVDGDNGLGLVVGPAANRIAMDKAQAVGSGWVSVCNTNHFGIAGYYVLEALKQDLIGWAMTNASRLVVPLWGAERRLGTNPIAVGFPALEEPPIVIDMATSTVPYGKIEMARRLGQSIPHGWGIDAEGQSTTDPAAVVEGGGLVPLGGERERSGHKGYALSGMVDVLSGVLSGANWGPFTPPFGLGLEGGETRVGKGIGHCFGALQVAGFRDPLSFKQEVDHWIRTMRGTAPATGTNGPLVPGDPERIAAAERERDGVPLSPAVLADLRTVAHETGVPFD